MPTEVILIGEITGNEDYQMCELGLKVGPDSNGWVVLRPVSKDELKRRVVEMMRICKTSTKNPHKIVNFEKMLQILLNGSAGSPSDGSSVNKAGLRYDTDKRRG